MNEHFFTVRDQIRQSCHELFSLRAAVLPKEVGSLCEGVRRDPHDTSRVINQFDKGVKVFG